MVVFKHIILSVAAAMLMLSCAGEDRTIPVITWAGVPPQESAEVFPLLKECGIDIHLGLYGSGAEAITALDAAQNCGMKIIAGFPQIKDSTEQSISVAKDHPALFAWHLKDEPETWDLPWLSSLAAKVQMLDPKHPPYINLYPNWAWGGESYPANIEKFAEEVDVPFYSFDQYPITENEDGSVSLRPGWYRNLEEFSAMSRRHGKDFWAFALTTSHHLGAPSPEAFYPVPTAGHLRLQVFSDLLYGAQAIQYFTAGGIVDVEKHCPSSIYDIVKEVNSEIKAYSPVFFGCEVKWVRHTGDSIPDGTLRIDISVCPDVEKLEISGNGGVVSSITNGNKEYLVVQNRDCVNPAILEARFTKEVRRLTPEGASTFNGKTIKLEPGDIAVFQL